jgi:uncharacterized membrane protein HdeD (DUF308 family)
MWQAYMDSRRRGIGDPNQGLPCLAAAGGLVSLTLMLAFYFVMHGLVQIVTAFRHRTLLPQSWLWMLLSGIADVMLAVIIIAGWPETSAWALGLLVNINLFLSGLALVMTAIACRGVDPLAPMGQSVRAP